MNDKSTTKKIELLAPAGNLAKLKYAILFGADAVYCGVPDFSLRVRINEFTKDDLAEAVRLVHAEKKKIYVTLNIYAHNSHLEEIKKHILFLKKLKVDAIIASDPGIILLIQKHWPEVEIHLSTQANATNSAAVEFWKKQGIRRIILAREVSLEEIREIAMKIKDIELEYFIHGAMCMSYSGRCILSKWMTNRSANLGDCSQPCRWAYKMQSQKSKVKNQKAGLRCAHDYVDISIKDDQERFGMDVEEDSHGTYFFNSYDMNLLTHIDKLMAAGIKSLKIEGRAKSAYYVAIVTRAYRKVIDAIETHCDDSLLRKIINEQKEELETLAHRGYSTGFLLGTEPEHNFSGENNKSGYQFVGEVEGRDGDCNIIRMHNSVVLGDKLEAVAPDGNSAVKLKKIFDHNRQEVAVANGGHANRYYFEFDKILEEGSLLRKKI